MRRPGDSADELSLELVFDGEVITWRGPSPYHFVPIPPEACAELRAIAPMATYGWGVVPVTARVRDVTFTTSLFPRDGGYLLPLKDAVRRSLRLAPGDPVTVELTVTV